MQYDSIEVDLDRPATVSLYNYLVIPPTDHSIERHCS